MSGRRSRPIRRSRRRGCPRSRSRARCRAPRASTSAPARAVNCAEVRPDRKVEPLAGRQVEHLVAPVRPGDGHVVRAGGALEAERHEDQAAPRSRTSASRPGRAGRWSRRGSRRARRSSRRRSRRRSCRSCRRCRITWIGQPAHADRHVGERRPVAAELQLPVDDDRGLGRGHAAVLRRRADVTT